MVTMCVGGSIGAAEIYERLNKTVLQKKNIVCSVAVKAPGRRGERAGHVL